MSADRPRSAAPFSVAGGIGDTDIAASVNRLCAWSKHDDDLDNVVQAFGVEKTGESGGRGRAAIVGDCARQGHAC